MAAEQNWLRQYLNVFWLRPENALFRSLQCQALAEVEFEQPSLDLNCGDGVSSFLMGGGEFEQSFDVFGATDDLDDFFENEDIYNAVPGGYDPDIAKRPDFEFTVGNDIKPNLLKKAAALDYYDELIEHDNNEPLPFEDDRFRTVFGNSIYYIDELELHLDEIQRVMHPDGKGVFALFTEHVHDFLRRLSNKYESELGTNLIEMIDRGRSDNHERLYDDEGWTRKLNDAGFEVVERKQTVSWWHVNMWHIGLRPISPHLIRMAYGLPLDQRLSVKADWLDTWEGLLKPFAERGFDFGRETLPPELVYVVRPA